MKTRERILITGLSLFNRDGTPNISTVDIANEMNISPGNLYYHFRNKEEIIKSIFERLEQELGLILDINADSFSNILEVWLYIKLLHEKLWQYRFLYRDLNNLVGKTPFMGKHIKRMLERKAQAIHHLCSALNQAQQLEIDQQHLKNLVDQMVFKITFWINHAYLFAGEQGAGEHILINNAVYQFFTLLEPFLSEEALDVLRELSMSDLGR